LLTDDEEEVLVSFMLAQDLEVQPVNRKYICDKVREWKKLDSNWNSWRWWKGFVKRNSRYFSCRQGKALDKKRHTDKLVSNTEAFIEWYQNVLEKHKTTARWILNADESPLKIEPRELIDAVCVRSSSKRADILMPKLKGHVSVLPIVSASGEVWLSVYILKAKKTSSASDTRVVLGFTPEKRSRIQRSDWKRMYMGTEAGFINSDAWKNTMMELERVIRPFWGSEKVILVVDNATPHKSLDAIKWMHEHNMYMVYLPPNTSHLLQPLDQEAFANWKRHLLLEVKSVNPIRFQTVESLTEVLIQMGAKAERKAFTKKILVGCWRKTGLYPFDPDVVRGRVVEGVENKCIESRTPDPTMNPTMMGLVELFRRDNQEIGKAIGKKVCVRVQRDTPFTSEMLEELSAKQEAEKRLRIERGEQKKEARKALQLKRKREMETKKAAAEERKMAKRRKRVEDSCRVCDKLWSGAKSWIGCEHCDWWVCTACSKEQGNFEKLQRHEEQHEQERGRVRKRAWCGA
jgi:hypothetical protein